MPFSYVVISCFWEYFCSMGTIIRPDNRVMKKSEVIATDKRWGLVFMDSFMMHNKPFLANKELLAVSSCYERIYWS